jgi:catechol 2,3-dioxygenase-like lactoylglutathione lyase family enzyme
MTQAKLTASAPILLVADVKASAAFYKEKLGFEINQIYDDPVNFCILKRDGLFVFLSQVADKSKIVPHYKNVHNMWNIYFWTDNLQALHDEFKAKGVEIDYGPETREYGVKEFGIMDLDGYDVAFAEILKE